MYSRPAARATPCWFRSDAAPRWLVSKRAKNNARRACSVYRSNIGDPGQRPLFLRQFLQVGLELVVLVFHGVEKQALREIGPALVVVHLLDEVVDLLHHVF